MGGHPRPGNTWNWFICTHTLMYIQKLSIVKYIVIIYDIYLDICKIHVCILVCIYFEFIIAA